MSRLQAILSAVSTCLLPLAAFGQCGGYAVEVFEGPVCQFASPLANAVAIAEDGSVKGTFLDCNQDLHSMIWWADGAMTELPFSQEGAQPGGVDLNDFGEVTGSMHVPGLVPPNRAFLYSNGVTVNLGVLPGTNHNFSEGHGISNSGIVCGLSMNTISGPLTSFVWQSGRMSALNLPMGPWSNANDISNQDKICGWMGVDPTFGAHGYIYDVRSQQVIDILPPSISLGLNPFRINNHDDLCGTVYYPPAPPNTILRRAFLWTQGSILDLGVLPGFDGSLAHGINDSKVVIGYCEASSNGNEAFVWRNGIMYQLDALFPKDSNIQMSVAWDINNAGQIVGNGIKIGHSGQLGIRITPLPSTNGDINCDSVINVDDLLGVINHWADEKPKGSNALPQADFTHDGIVDFQDLMIVINNWS